MQSKPIALTILEVLSIIGIGVATYFALVFAPTEAIMGNVQRVFYFHVGTAWVGLIGFVVLFNLIADLLYAVLDPRIRLS